MSISRRKNIVDLSDAELLVFREALRKMQELPADNPDSYHFHASLHGFPVMPNAAELACPHGNSLFPTWHRAYMHHFETALRKQVPEAQRAAFGLPYWDSASEETQSQGLPRAVMEEKYKDAAGREWDNPLYSYRFVADLPLTHGSTELVKRAGETTLRAPYVLIDHAGAVRGAEQGEAWNSAVRAAMQRRGVSKQRMDELLQDHVRRAVVFARSSLQGALVQSRYWYFASTGRVNSPYTSVEHAHNWGHAMVGGNARSSDLVGGVRALLGFDVQLPFGQEPFGDMGSPELAGFEPVFWLHHCNVDRWIEIWRSTRIPSSLESRLTFDERLVDSNTARVTGLRITATAEWLGLRQGEWYHKAGLGPFALAGTATKVHQTEGRLGQPRTPHPERPGVGYMETGHLFDLEPKVQYDSLNSQSLFAGGGGGMLAVSGAGRDTRFAVPGSQVAAHIHGLDLTRIGGPFTVRVKARGGTGAVLGRMAVFIRSSGASREQCSSCPDGTVDITVPLDVATADAADVDFDVFVAGAGTKDSEALGRPKLTIGIHPREVTPLPEAGPEATAAESRAAFAAAAAAKAVRAARAAKAAAEEPASMFALLGLKSMPDDDDDAPAAHASGGAAAAAATPKPIALEPKNIEHAPTGGTKLAVLSGGPFLLQPATGGGGPKLRVSGFSGGATPPAHAKAGAPDGTWITPSGFDIAEPGIAEQLIFNPRTGTPPARAKKVVAVLDSGCDIGHPAFRNVTIRDVKNFTGDDGGLAWMVMDRNGHGTHCAGCVVGGEVDLPARVPGGEPVKRRLGVVSSSHVELLVGKVLDNEGSGSMEWIAAGIKWAVESGANVISMSLGISFFDPFSGVDDVLGPAVHEALAAGVTVVCAAGNDGLATYGEVIGLPGRYGSVITVASHGFARLPSVFSSRGGEVDFAGPGEDILSAWPRSAEKQLVSLRARQRGQAITYRADEMVLARLSGTSMATPYVSGLATLAAQSGARTCFQVKETIRRFADRPDFHDRETGHGCLTSVLQYTNLGLHPM